MTILIIKKGDLVWMSTIKVVTLYMTENIIWVTKHRYKVLSKPIASKLRELIRQDCEARNIAIVRGSI